MANLKAKYDPLKLKELTLRAGLIHSKYGDLMRPASVTLPESGFQENLYRESKPYFIHLSITNRCNAGCKGCVNSEITDANFRAGKEDTDPVRDAKAISKIISKLDKEIVICLYGGEPLLEPEKIRSLIKEINAGLKSKKVRYMLYTNGSFLERMLIEFKDVMEKLWLISISIDGSKEQQEKFRPGINLENIHSSLKKTKQIFGSNILMLSTLREEQSLLDCFQEFMRLYRQGSADYFFWHWIETKDPFIDFSAFAMKYEQELRIIMQNYIEILTSENIVLPITHINELLMYIFTGKKRQTTACAVEEKRNYDILGGKIYACSDLPKDYIIGTIDKQGKPEIEDADLSGLTGYKKHLGCDNCGIGAYCGGRCPVQAVNSSEERLLEYCQLMRLHVGIVNDYAPLIKDILNSRHYSLQDIYDRCVFINQFTDVTP